MTNKVVRSGRKNDLGTMIPHIVQTACSFKSSITFEVGDKRVNAKSIMGVMALASHDIDEIQVYANGADENDALEAISALLV